MASLKEIRLASVYSDMRIWTTQAEAFWDQLQAQGTIYCESSYAQKGNNYLDRYDWISEQMRRRVGPPPRPEIQYPIWGWKQLGNHKKECRPDYRGWHLIDEQVFLTLEVPEDKVLLSDFDLWGSAVWNYLYIPADKADYKRFSKVQDRLPLDYENWPEDTKNEVMQSWVRVFDLDHPNFYATKLRRNRWIQATFWELKKEWVVDCFPLHGCIRTWYEQE